jgi:hypothetical protein
MASNYSFFDTPEKDLSLSEYSQVSRSFSWDGDQEIFKEDIRTRPGVEIKKSTKLEDNKVIEHIRQNIEWGRMNIRRRPPIGHIMEDKKFPYYSFSYTLPSGDIFLAERSADLFHENDVVPDHSHGERGDLPANEDGHVHEPGGKGRHWIYSNKEWIEFSFENMDVRKVVFSENENIAAFVGVQLIESRTPGTAEIYLHNFSNGTTRPVLDVRSGDLGDTVPLHVSNKGDQMICKYIPGSGGQYLLLEVIINE